MTNASGSQPTITTYKKQLPGSQHRIVQTCRSSDKKHTVALVEFWNEYVMVVAIFLDEKLLDWRETICGVIFSPDSQKMAFVIRDIEDPAFEEAPDAEPDHWHVALIEDLSEPGRRVEFGPYYEKAPEIYFDAQELRINFPIEE